MENAPAPPGAAEAASRRERLVDLGLLLLAWAVLRKLQLSAASAGFGTDVAGYYQHARAWASGSAPYIDWQLEYPPGALPIFLLPLLAAGPLGYVKGFVAEMACFDLASLLLVRALARRAWPEHPRRALAAAGGYLAATALLHPVLYSRFDLAPATLVLAALFLGPTPWGAALLGLAGAVKLWPLALAPLWLVPAWRRGGARALAGAAGSLLLGVLAPAVLVLPRAGLGVAALLRYHSARGLQIESTWATLAMLFPGPSRIVDEYGAYHLRCGAPCGLLQAVTAPAMVALALLPQVLALRRHPAGGLPVRPWVRSAAAAVVGVLVGSNVLSPQFLLWAVPLLVLSGGARLLAAACALAGLTSLIYPVLYPQLVDARQPLHQLAFGVLALRNLGLISVYAALVASLARAGGGPAAPRTGAREGGPGP